MEDIIKKRKIQKIRPKYRLCTAKTHNQYKRELKEINPEIKVIGVYVNSKKPIPHKCLKCNKIWDTAPSNLLSGHGCKCNFKKPLDPKGFFEVLHREMPNISMINKPPYYKDDLFVKCDICGYEWHTQYANLINAHKGCTPCGKKRMGDVRRLSHNEFVEKLHMIFPNLNPLEEYKGSRYNIKFSCNVCNSTFSKKPNEVLNGHGCNECSKKSQRISKDEFLKRLKDTGSTYELISNFTKISDVMTFKCCVCNNIINTTGSTLVTGKMCKKCWANKKIQDHSNNLDGIKNKLKDQYIILDEYNGFHIPISIQKISCGHIWKAPLNSIKNYDNYCPQCRMDNLNFKLDKLNKSDDIEVIDRSLVDDKMLFKCKICNNEWRANVYNILKGNRCPNKSCIAKRISDANKMSHSEFVEKLSIINPNIKVLGKYTLSQNYIEVQCLVCGNIWNPTANSLINKTGCPKCRQSHGEIEVSSYLENHKIKYESQKKFPELGRLSYDFYIPADNLLIEYQGRQHYQAVEYFGGEETFILQQDRDKRKRNFAKENNINLLEIKYNEDVTEVLNNYYNLSSKSVETVIPTMAT